jgi:hypothetical protein
MAKTDNLKLVINVNGAPVYFGAPVFYSFKTNGDGEVAIIQTEIGNQQKQRIEIQIKNHTYVEPSVLVSESGSKHNSKENP